MSKTINNHKESLKPFFTIGLVVVALWIASLILVKFFTGKWDGAGTFGDGFGGLNALFSGLAFAGIIYTILLQRKELMLQRQELQETREVLKQSAEAHKETSEIARLTSLLESSKFLLEYYKGKNVNSYNSHFTKLEQGFLVDIFFHFDQLKISKEKKMFPLRSSYSYEKFINQFFTASTVLNDLKKITSNEYLVSKDDFKNALKLKDERKRTLLKYLIDFNKDYYQWNTELKEVEIRDNIINERNDISLGIKQIYYESDDKINL